MSTVTYDKQLRATRVLDDRDYREITDAIIRSRHALNRDTRDLAFHRVLDILNPRNVPPLAPVVAIESLAPDPVMEG